MCRTLLGNDVNGLGYSKIGRGNVSPVTMNLPMLGVEHGICLGERKEPDIEGFFKDLNDLLDLATESLLDRFKYICAQNPRSGAFMYDNGTIEDYDKTIEKNNIYESMKHGTNALGFIGLENTCWAMFGKFYQDDPNVMEFAKKVVKTIYDRAKANTAKYHLNFSAYGSPAESAAATLCRKIQAKYGKIKNVSDREYLTNSYHIPVFVNIPAREKIKLEAEFAWMCTGGAIQYIELNSGVMGNPRAVEKLIDYAMSNNKVVYFAINYPIDTCQKCGFSGEIDDDKCPACGSDEILRLRRVTGYITTDYRHFNKGKFDETNDRVKHSI